MQARIVMLIDSDYFYAQCEERRNPSLKSKPVVVCVYSGRTEDSGAVSKMLKKLAAKAQIDLNNKRLTFHCFRKMFLSASIDSGIGLTAGKLLCGKAISVCTKFQPVEIDQDENSSVIIPSLYSVSSPLKNIEGDLRGYI